MVKKSEANSIEMSVGFFWRKILQTTKANKNFSFTRPGADAIKKVTPSLGIPYLGV